MTPLIRMVSVPKEPTEAMMLAGALVGPDTNNGVFSYDDARTVFTAMLNAAPVREEGGAVDRAGLTAELHDYLIAARRKKSLTVPKDLGRRLLATLATCEEGGAMLAFDLRCLKEAFEKIAARPPEDQPHYKSGVRPFGTGDLRHIIEVLTKAAAFAAREEAQPVARLRPVVLAFAHLMEAKLKENDWKRGWKKDTALSLMARLREETNELDERVQARARFQVAINPPPAPRLHELIANEAADVANFAMMVADVCGGLPESAVRSIAESATPPAPEAEKLRAAVEALEKASRAISAQYALAQAEYQHLDTVASKHDKIVQEGRRAIREALAALQQEGRP